MSRSVEELGGLPIHKWVGRMVMVKRPGFNRPITAKLELVSANGKNCTVKAGSRTMTVSADSLKPWWAENPDLKALVQNAVDDEQPEASGGGADGGVATAVAPSKVISSKALQALKEEQEAKLSNLRSKRVSFTVGDLLLHKDQIIGNLGVIVTQAKELGDAINYLTEQIELSASVEDTFDKACAAMGNWIE